MCSWPLGVIAEDVQKNVIHNAVFHRFFFRKFPSKSRYRDFLFENASWLKMSFVNILFL